MFGIPFMFSAMKTPQIAVAKEQGAAMMSANFVKNFATRHNAVPK